MLLLLYFKDENIKISQKNMIVLQLADDITTQP
jgi:hypothetical protein